MALILAIAFLGILSIIGAVVLRYANEGMTTAGKVTPAKRAFNVADRAVEFAVNREMIITLAGMVPGAATLELHDPANLTTTNVPWRNLINSNNAGLIEGTVTDLGPGDLPAGLAGMFGTDFSANFYQVQVKVGTPPPTYTNATDLMPKASYLQDVADKKVTVTHVNASIVRLFKLDDDSIFRTSGSGG
jgi:hypothetical protein